MTDPSSTLLLNLQKKVVSPQTRQVLTCFARLPTRHCFGAAMVLWVVERMNAKDLLRLGVPLGEPMRRATDFISQFVLSGADKVRIEDEVKAIVNNPSPFRADSCRGA